MRDEDLELFPDFGAPPTPRGAPTVRVTRAPGGIEVRIFVPDAAITPTEG